MIRGWHVALMLGILAILALFYKGLGMNPRYIPSVLVGKPAPSFQAPDLLNGESVSLEDYRGKVVLVNFWASWCTECRWEHENLMAIQRRFGKDPRFVFLGINFQDQPEDARRFLETLGMSYHRVLQDPSGRIAIDYGVYGVPETFVIGPDGIIRFKQVGPIIGPVFRHLTERILVPLLQGEEVAS